MNSPSLERNTQQLWANINSVYISSLAGVPTPTSCLTFQQFSTSSVPVTETVWSNEVMESSWYQMGPSSSHQPTLLIPSPPLSVGGAQCSVGWQQWYHLFVWEERELVSSYQYRPHKALNLLVINFKHIHLVTSSSSSLREKEPGWLADVENEKLT